MQKIIEKVAAIIIQDQKILLVGHNRQPFYWTPGGKIDPGETPEQTLHRELQEELTVDISTFQQYFTYLSEQEEDGISRKVYCYLVTPQGSIQLNNEIEKSLWFSKADYLHQPHILQSGVRHHLIPRLIQDQIL